MYKSQQDRVGAVRFSPIGFVRRRRSSCSPCPPDRHHHLRRVHPHHSAPKPYLPATMSGGGPPRKRNFKIEVFRHRVDLDPKYAERTWKALEQAINEIYNHNASGLSFEELYRSARLIVIFAVAAYCCCSTCLAESNPANAMILTCLDSKNSTVLE
jgi:hypothetical protein